MLHMEVTFNGKMVEDGKEMEANICGLRAHDVDNNNHRDSLPIGSENVRNIEIEKGITIPAEHLFK